MHTDVFTQLARLQQRRRQIKNKYFFVMTEADVKSSSWSVAFYQQILHGLKYSLQIHSLVSTQVVALSSEIVCLFVCLLSHHHGALVVNGPSAVDETVNLLSRKRRGVPAV